MYVNNILSHFINLTQVHNFTVSAQDIFAFRILSVFTVSFTGIFQVLMHIVKRFVQSYRLVKWLCYRVYNQNVVSSSPRVFFFFFFFFYLYSIRLISFIIDVPRPLRYEILDHSFSKGWYITRKMSQSVRNIFRDSRENIVPYYSQNIRLKIIHFTCCLNLGSVGKRLKKSLQQVLALRQSRYFLNICDYFKNMSKAQRFNFTHRAYGRRSRWGFYKNNNNKCKHR